MQTLYKSLGAIGISWQHADPSSLDLKRQEFSEHIIDYGFSYGTKEEFEFRFEQYLKSDEIISSLNSRNLSFTAGHNQFSTFTDAEFSKMLGKMPSKDRDRNYVHLDESSVTADSFDWRSKSAVNAVQDQGYCGSCWAFSTIAGFETAHWIKTGKLLKLSEQ